MTAPDTTPTRTPTADVIPGPPAAARWWVSWYSDGHPFEYHGPWWITGYDGADRATICAAVCAETAADAKRVIYGVHDQPRPADLEWRFAEPCSAEWSPFSDRFPRDGWMRWPYPDTAASAPDTPPTDRAGFVAAVREHAFPTDGGPIVHCFVGTPFLVGADWAVDDVVAAVERAVAVEWINGVSGHDLAVLDTDGKTWRYQVPRPERGDG